MADIIVGRGGSLPLGMRLRLRDLGEGIYARENYVANIADGVPVSFSQSTSNGRTWIVAKGQLNKLRLRPQILNEHTESSREIQGTVDASTIVGQIFKASQDNINGLMITLESTGGTVLDNFESYANDAALQIVWVKGGTNEARLETTIVKTGTKSMNLPLDVAADSWVKTAIATDYTDYTFGFDYYQDKEFDKAQVSLFIGDGVNTKSIQLPLIKNIWSHFQINEKAMDEDGGGTTDITAITKIGFRVDKKEIGKNGYVDNLVATPPPGEVELRLWDMGADIPISGITALDAGTQYTQLGDIGFEEVVGAASIYLSLKGGKRLYNIDEFVAGVALEIPTNEVLTAGHYYGVTIHYVDTEVDVYGPDSSFGINYYVNGYAFTAPDTATPLTQVGANSDLMFGILSVQDVYINTVVKFFDAQPGVNATEFIFVEDENMKITDLIVGAFRPLQQVQAEFDRAPVLLNKGGKFEVYLNDDFTDGVTAASVLIGYLYEPPTVNG